VGRWQSSNVTAVVGVPGDRSDELIRECARAVGAVDRVIVREDDDTRGRNRGDVADLIKGVLENERPELPVDVVLNELESVDAAISAAPHDAIVIMFVDDVDRVIDRLQAHGAQPVAGFAPLVRAPGSAALPAA
jgi:cyanophycin synthetase